MAIITTSSQEEQPQAQQPQPQPELQPQPQPTVQSSEATASFKEKIAVPYALYALRIAQAIVAVVILGLTGDLLSQNGGGSFAVIRILPTACILWTDTETRLNHSLYLLYGSNVLSHNYGLL